MESGQGRCGARGSFAPEEGALFSGRRPQGTASRRIVALQEVCVADRLPKRLARLCGHVRFGDHDVIGIDCILEVEDLVEHVIALVEPTVLTTARAPDEPDGLGLYFWGRGGLGWNAERHTKPFKEPHG